MAGTMTAQLPLPIAMDAGAVPIGPAVSLVEDDGGGASFCARGTLLRRGR